MPKEKKFNKKSDRSRSARSNKAGSDVDGTATRGGSKRKENDISWYTKYPTLIGPNAQINFNVRYGSKIPSLTINGQPSVGGGVVETTTPGLALYKYIPMYADGANVGSAVNVALKNLYTFVRHANSGSVNYESSDLMQYIITVMNIYTQIEQVKRDLRIVHTYNAENKYVGMFTLTALRGPVYAKHMLDNAATIAGHLNTIVGKVNAFKIPKDIAVLDRHLWLSSNVFRDDTLIKHTSYIAHTNYYAHYDWANQQVQVAEQTFTNATLLLDAINSEVDNLLSYEDIGIMIGDILKAYKQEGCRVLSPIQLGEILVPAYSDELLLQLRNATIPGFFEPNENGYTVKQMTGNSQIIYAEQNGFTRTDGTFTYSVATIGTVNLHQGCAYNQPLTIPNDNPTNEEIIIGTRLALSYEFFYNSGLNKYRADITNYCSELPEALEVHSYKGDPNNFDGDEQIQTSDPVYTAVVLGTFSNADLASKELTGFLTGINQIHKITGTIGYSVFINYLDSVDGDILGLTNYYNGKNVITLDIMWLKRLHDACKLSLWTMPMFKLLEQ